MGKTNTIMDSNNGQKLSFKSIVLVKISQIEHQFNVLLDTVIITKNHDTPKCVEKCWLILLTGMILKFSQRIVIIPTIAVNNT